LIDSVRLPLQPLRFWPEIAKLSRQDAATAIRQDVAKRNYYNPSV